VGIHLDNAAGLEALVLHWAAQWLGAVPVPVGTRLAGPEVDHLVAHAGLTVMCSGLGHLALASAAVERSAPAGRVRLLDCSAGLLALTAGRPARPAAAVDEDDLADVLYTSGTTGRPKGAIFTNRELAAITASDGGDSWGGGGAMLASTQFAHVGFMTKLPWYLRLATTTYLLDRWRASDVLRLVAQHRMPSVGGVAPQVALMLRDPDFDTYDLSSVKTLIMGGAASPPALVREARERFGAAYSIRYSSTESGGIGLGTAFDADDEEALYTVGRPRPGVEIKVVDDDAQEVGDGDVGELCLRSPMMLSGYWRDPAATAEALRDGWLHTGDLALVDAQGCVRLAGRKKEMFVRGGYNVYPMEVEAVLASHPAVADLAVVPRPDPVMGEIGVAVVVPRDAAAPPTLDELRAFATDRLAPYKHPEALRLGDALPLTAMQKVDRQALAAHEARRATAAAEASS
jgi:acyl-CoA synthetase (AMP-forming)/AMP-acid ligase II